MERAPLNPQTLTTPQIEAWLDQLERLSNDYEARRRKLCRLAGYNDITCALAACQDALDFLAAEYEFRPRRRTLRRRHRVLAVVRDYERSVTELRATTSLPSYSALPALIRRYKLEQHNRQRPQVVVPTVPEARVETLIRHRRMYGGPSQSVFTVGGGLPTLGRGHR